MNFYERPAQLQFIDTYAALPIQEMMALGQQYQKDKETTEANLKEYRSLYGDFASLSSIDTANYDKEYSNVIQGVQELARSSDGLKSLEARDKVNMLINNVNISKLSKLREGALMLKVRAANIAKMKAEGLYNEDWDNVNMNLYNTLDEGILANVTPIAYKTAALLSKPYFEDLKPGTIDFVFQDGVKYKRTGNTVLDLEAVAEAKASDLIDTPQGNMYYQQFLKENNGDAEAATTLFKKMIVAANMSKTLRPRLDVDEGWLAKLRIDAAGRQKSDKEPREPEPTLIDFIDKSYSDVVKSRTGSDIGNYRNYIESLVKKYPNTKIAADAARGVKGIDRQLRKMATNTDAIQEAINVSNKYIEMYKTTGKDSYLVLRLLVLSKAQELQEDSLVRAAKLLNLAILPMARQEFKKGAGFGIEDIHNPNKYSSQGFLNGVKKATSMFDFLLSDKTAKDILLDNSGGFKSEITDKDGAKNQIYAYSSSKGFILPETLLSMQLTDVKRNIAGPTRTTKRDSGLFGSERLDVKRLIESGSIRNVLFIADNTFLRVVSGRDAKLVAKGKLRIPTTELLSVLGGGYLWPIYQERLKTAMEREFGARIVEETIGDGKYATYYEIDAPQILHSSAEISLTTNQLWKNSEGIGGSSHEKDTFGDSSKQVLSK